MVVEENGPGEPETAGLGILRLHVQVETPPEVENPALARVNDVEPMVIVVHPELDCVPLITKITSRM
jgi:hypothetical protein